MNLDKFTVAQLRTHCTVDAASRVFWKGTEMEIHLVGAERKVIIPGTKVVISVNELVTQGAKLVGQRGPQNFRSDGGTTRWIESVKRRNEDGIPPNVYVANARSVQYALDKGNAPPVTRWVGRRQGKVTEVYDTIDEVVKAMNDGLWRTDFARGRHAKRKV
jgi:hypothetical protein